MKIFSFSFCELLKRLSNIKSDTNENIVILSEIASLAFLPPALEESVNLIQVTLFYFKLNVSVEKFKNVTLATQLKKITVRLSFTRSRMNRLINREHYIRINLEIEIILQRFSSISF